MNQAQKIAEMLKQDLHKLDDWITGDLTARFLRDQTTTLNIMYDTPELKSSGLKTESIEQALRMHGFHVDFDCPDRPCATPYYKITIPSQED